MNSLDNLTPEERQLVMRQLLVTPVTSKEDLRNFLIYFFDVDLADCTVSRYSTSNPLDMVWEIYSFCAATDNVDPKVLLYVAGRSSQKTLSCSVLHVVLPIHFGRSVIHFGGTERQSSRAFNYDKAVINKPLIKPLLVGIPTMIKTQLLYKNEPVDLEVNPLTEASVQGGHSSILSLDELSSLAPNKLAAYPDLNGIPVFTRDGKPWLRFGISSRKGKATVIETEYENREKSGIDFRFWTVFENTKRCPDEISGTNDLPMYVDILDNKAILEDEYVNLNAIEKMKFERVVAKENCIKCPLAVVCAGDAKKQTSTCRSLRPIQSVIKEFKNSEYQWFLSQAMSLRPSSEDLVYPKFDRKTFEKTPREMYKIFLGIDPGVELTKLDIIREFIKAGVKRYAGIDHGYTHPFAIVIVFEDSVGNVFVMKAYEESQLEPGDLVDLVAKLKAEYQFTAVHPDTAAPAINKMLKKVTTVKDDFKKDVDAGIQLIRHKMSPSVGPTKFYGLKGEVTPLIDNLEKYHFQLDTGGKLTDKPVKEFDDSHDALSYIAQNRWNSSKAIINPAEAVQESEIGKDNKEKSGIYKAKVEKQYDNWMQKEIGSAITEQGASPGMSQSKNKSHFWDIE